jgi:hypothetical protein
MQRPVVIVDCIEPDIRKGDIPWSKVFEDCVKILDEVSYLCFALDSVLSHRRFEDQANRQADRMKYYILSLLGGDCTVIGWVWSNVPGICQQILGNVDFLEYRKAWAKHLSEQFKSKGL